MSFTGGTGALFGTGGTGSPYAVPAVVRRTPSLPRLAAVVPGATYITMEGRTFPPPNTTRYFSALCGDEPPTITDGYAKWAVIDRPLLQGVTVPQGFNPARLKVGLRFGVWDGRFGFQGWDTSPAAADEVESNIDDLHWMAGGNALAGASPAIYVNAYDPQTRRKTPLCPPQYNNVAWVIDGGVQWGKALRDGHGKRVYQEAEFTLLGYTSLPGPNTSPPKQVTGQTGGYYKTNQAVHTMLAIAGAPSSHTPEAFVERLANMIRTDRRNNPIKGSRISLERRSLIWPLQVGLDVWVPSRSF